MKSQYDYSAEDFWSELEADNWYQAVLDRRKAPPDSSNRQQLCCLKSLEFSSLSLSSPGVDAMIKVFNDQATLRQWRQSGRWSQFRSMSSWEGSESTFNPMGPSIPDGTRYDLTCLSKMSREGSVGPPSGEGGGLFFQTELDFDEVEPPSAQKELSRSSSVPVLPRLGHSTSKELETKSSMHSFAFRSLLKSGRLSSSSSRDPTRQRGQQLNQSLVKVLQGKCVLVLTDKPDVRKFVLRVALPSTMEGPAPLCFVRTSSELWAKFREVKEQFHALILDLGKAEMQAETLVRTIREHDRYGKIPIVVLADGPQLSETVRNHCSFVVYFPLSASMLREALLWCFDRKVLKSLVKYEVPLGSTSYAEEADTQGNPKEMTLAVLAVPVQAAVQPTPQAVVA